LAAAGRSDLAAYDRVWALTIRDADPIDRPEGPPAIDETVGPVRVRRWDPGPATAVYDFTERLDGATVTRARGDDELPCPRTRLARITGAGLGDGPTKPRVRFRCDAKKHW